MTNFKHDFKKLFLQKEVYKMFWLVYLLMSLNFVVQITLGNFSQTIGSATTFIWCHVALIFMWRNIQLKKEKAITRRVNRVLIEKLYELKTKNKKEE